ncbi:beta strand repeat-containing protein [Emticicia aquatilis]|nr:hypothetical protein [Emticicia aquatilis]
MNSNYTKTHLSLSVKAFFVKMYLLIKSMIANFYEKISEKIGGNFREIVFLKTPNLQIEVKEHQGFDSFFTRTFSRFYSRSAYRDLVGTLALTTVTLSTIAQIANAPANIKSPWVNGTYTNISASETNNNAPVSLRFVTVSNVNNVTNSTTSDNASISITGIGGQATIRVIDNDAADTYPAGTFAGFRIGTTGLLSGTIASTVIIRTYNNGVIAETYNAVTSLLGINSSLLNGDGTATVGFVTTADFDEISIEYTTLVGLLFNAEVYHAVIEKYAPGSSPCQCGSGVNCGLNTYANSTSAFSAFDGQTYSTYDLNASDLSYNAGQSYELCTDYTTGISETIIGIRNLVTFSNLCSGLTRTYSLKLKSDCSPAGTALGANLDGGSRNFNYYTVTPNTTYRACATVTMPACSSVGPTGQAEYSSSAWLIFNATSLCSAGAVAPTLSSTTISNVCSATTVNLNQVGLVTSTTPANASLVWFTNNAHTGAAYATPTTAGVGTYYAFYYDSAIGCYSPASAAVTVNIIGCSTNILALANSIYVDNGVGGGTAGNCVRDGSESANGLVTGLNVNLVSGSTVAYSAPIQPDGSYQLLSVANGSYTMIIASTPTATSVTLPTGWSMSSGTGSIPVVVSGGNLITPATAPSFCLKYCPVISSVTNQSPTICGLTDGSITLSGLRPGVSYGISYVKDGGAAVNTTIIANASGVVTIPSLGAGAYTNITATEGGCSSPAVTSTISNPAGPDISGTLKNDPTSCTGNGIYGSIILQGLTPNTTYTVGYYKDAATTETTGTFTTDGAGEIILTNLTAGVYNNIYATLNGCASPTVDVTLVGPTPPAAPILGVNTISNTCPATSVNLLTLSGTPPNGRTHEWHNANNTLPSSLVANPSAVSASGTYYVFAKSNASGCYSSGTPVTVTINICTATLSAPANTVYNDNGSGGGFAGNCVKDGTESATGLPGGLYINLIQGGLVKYSTAVNVDGSYVLSGILDGTYTLIISNTATATTSAMPTNFSLSSGTGSVNITVANSALTTPTALPAFCVRQNPTCDSINGTISVTPTGGTVGAGMTQKYLLLTPTGVILQESSVPTFIGLPAGNYNVVAIIYDIKPYTVGGNISAVTASACVGISAPVNFTVCGSSIAAVAGSVYNDNGAGGGTAGDCIQNGTEITSPIPSGLFVNLIQGATVIKSAAVQADGSYVVPSILDGTYTLIITNSAIATTSVLPVTWSVGVGSVPVVVAGGSVVTPNPAPKYCLKQGFPDIVTVLSQPTTTLVENAVSQLPVSVSNQGLSTATGQLTFTTTLPNSLSAPATFLDNGWTCITVLQTVSCTNPNATGLAPSANYNFNIPITPVIGSAGQTPPVVGTVTPVLNEQVTPNNTSLVTIATPIVAMPRPDLVTTLGQPSPSLQEGSASNIPVTISNIGNAPATGALTFTSALPNGYTAPAIFTQNGWTCMTSGQTVSCSNPNASGIAPTANTTFNIPITPSVGTAGTTTPISGTVSPVLNENVTPNNTATVTPSVAVAPLPRPDLVTTIGQPSTPLVEGQASNIPVTIANNGNASGTGPLTFSTNLPNGYTAPALFNQGGWTCLTSAQTVTCTNPNTTGLAPAASTTFNIPITPAVGTAGSALPVSGTIAPVPTENVIPNNTATMVPASNILPMPRPDLVTTIGTPSPALTEGVTSNIPVTVTNQGTAPGTGPLTFTTTLPTGLTAPASFTNGGWTCSTLGQVVSCTTPNTTGLAPAATTTFNIPVTPAIGTVGTSPIITGTTAPVPNETTTPNNTATTQVGPVQIGARPDVVTTIGTPSPALTEGVTSNIPVTLTNQGNAPATGPLTFTTTLPTGLTAPATFGINGWSCSTTIQTVSCTNPNTTDLAPAATTTFNIPVTPALGTGGTTPTIVGSVSPVPNETTLPNNIAALTPSAPIAMGLRPDLAVTLGQATPNMIEGIQSNLPVSISNQGTSAATGVLTFTTNLPNGITAPATFSNGTWSCTTSGQLVTCTNPNASGLAPTAISNFNIPITPVTGTAGTSPSIVGSVNVVPNENVTGNNTASITISPAIQIGARPDLVTTIGQPSPVLQEGVTSNIPVTVTNVGNAPATGPLTFTTNLPNGLTAPATFGQNGWTCVTSGQTVSCTNPNTSDLAPVGLTTFNIPVTPQAGTAGTLPTLIGSTAPVVNETTYPNNIGIMTPTQAILPAARPDIVASIGQPSPTLTEGVTSNIPVTLTNQGNANGNGPLTFTTTLPNSLTAPASFSNSGWTCTTSGQTVTCTTPNATGLVPTGLTTFNIPVTPIVGSAGQTPSITGTSTPLSNETVVGNNTASITTSPIAAMARPDLVTTIGQPSPALKEGTPSNIPVTITNIGTAPATGPLTFTTTLPNGYSAPTSFTDGPWTCATSGQTVTCTNPNAAGISPTGNTTFNIPITPASTTVGTTPTITGTTAPVPNETGLANNTGTMTPTSPVSALARPDLVTTIGQPSPALTEGVTSNIPVTVTNVGTAPAIGPLSFTTTLPNGLTAPASFTDGPWTCSTSGQVVTCSSPNTLGLSPAGTTTFNIPVTPAVGTAGTTPTITGTSIPVPTETTTPNNTGSMTPTAPIAPMARPDLVTTIGQPSPALTEGVISNIPVTVTSVGTAPATGPLTFTTTLANGLTAPASFSNGGWTCSTSGQTVSCSTPNTAGLAPTASTTFNIPITPAVGSAGSTPTITGTVAPAPNETTTPNNTGSMVPTAPIAAMLRPDLVTTIGYPTPALQEGITSMIPVTIANIGNAAATGPLTFTTTLPNGLTAPAAFTDGSWVCSTTGQTVICINGNTAGLVPSTSTVFNIPVTSAVGTANTTPTISGTLTPVPTEAITANNTGTMTPTAPIVSMLRPDLLVSIGQPLPALQEGITSLLPVTITNVGNASAAGSLTFTTTLPNSLTAPTSFSNNGWSCTTSSQTVTCTTPNATGLIPSGSMTFEIPVTSIAGSAGTTPTVTGTVSPVLNEIVTPNNTGTMTPTAPIVSMLRPDLITTIGQPSPVLTEGVTSQIPVTVTNNGTATATGPLTFTTTLPNGLTAPASFSNGGWTCTTSGQTVTCTTPNTTGLAPTASTTFNIPITPAVGTAGTTPTIGGTTSPSPNETATGNNSGSMIPTTPIAAVLRPDLVTTIGQPSPALTEGVTSLIPVIVTSVGTAPATGPLTFTTTLANGLTAPASFSNGGWTCTTSGQTVTCTTPNTTGLAPTASTSFNIPITPAVGTAGTTPSVTGTTTPVPTETTTANNTGTMTPTAPIQSGTHPDLIIVFGTPTPVLIENVSSTIPVTVTNVGTASASGQLVVTFNIPNNTTSPLSYSAGNGWTCNASGAILTCANPNATGLAQAATTTFNIQLTPNANTAGQSVILNGSVTAVTGETVLTNNISVVVVPTPISSPSLKVSVKAFLQGAAVNGTGGLMRDDLRVKGLIPASQPYTTTNGYTHVNGGGTETVAPSVLTATGNDAIVDWVMVELRNSTTPSTVVATRSALIQRDGDIVDVNGTSAVSFNNLTAGNYYISVRHRNHLGVMTASPVAISATTPVVDFTSTSVANYVYPTGNLKRNTSPQVTDSGKNMLWAGNAYRDDKVIFQGPDNDVDAIFFSVMTDPTNVSSFTNFIRNSVYDNADVDMDGRVIFQGPNNEVDLIFFEVLTHPSNTSQFLNYIIWQQLP